MSKSKFLQLLFTILLVYYPIISYSAPGTPDTGGSPVPIDGGIGALLIAGGALGYKAYKNRKDEA